MRKPSGRRISCRVASIRSVASPPGGASRAGAGAAGGSSSARAATAAAARDRPFMQPAGNVTLSNYPRLGNVAVLTIGLIQCGEVVGDAVVDLLHAPGHLGRGVVLVAIVDRLE